MKKKTNVIQSEKCAKALCNVPKTRKDGLNLRIVKDPERRNDLKLQDKLVGFNETCTWNLDTSIAKYIYPRLVMFKNVHIGRPINLSCDKDWLNILDEMIDGFKLIADDDAVFEYNNKNSMKKMKRAIELLHKHYFDLWW